jgi:uncharacterized protein (DUF983 family)
VSVSEKSILTGISRGLACRCPSCGKGRLFSGFLKVRARCEDCGADNRIYPSDDFPPYLTIAVLGHILVPAFMWVDHAYEPAMWFQFAFWVPLTVIMAVALLPHMKGATVGLCWATNLVRETVPS